MGNKYFYLFFIDKNCLIFLWNYGPSHFKSAFKINFWFQEVVKPKMFLLAQLAQSTHFQFCPLPNVKKCFIKQIWNKKVHISILNPRLEALSSLTKSPKSMSHCIFRPPEVGFFAMAPNDRQTGADSVKMLGNISRYFYLCT